MANGPTLTTFHEWNVAGVKKGAAEIDAEYKKLIRNEQLAAKAQALNDQASGRRQQQTMERMKRMTHEGNNLRMAFRDFAEGRIAYGLARLGGNFLVVGTAAAIAYREVRKLNEEINRTVGEMEAFNDKSGRANQRAGFYSSASGSGTVAEAAVEAQDRAREGRQVAMKGGDSLNWKDDWSRIPTTAMYRASQALSDYVNKFREGHGSGEYRPIERAQETTEMEAELSRKVALRLSKTRSAALGRERDIVQAGGPGGSSYWQKYQENEMARDREIEAAKLLRMSEKDRDVIHQRYDILSKTLTLEHNIANVRFATSSQALQLTGSGASPFAKGLGAAGFQVQSSQALLNSGMLTEEQAREEGLRMHGAWNSQRAALMDRYLRPDGRRKREHEIQRTFRMERNAARRRNAFLRRVDRGQFNMETGRRASSPLSGGLGLHLGSLDTGHLPRGAFSGDRLVAHGGLDGGSADTYLQTIVKLLQRGLPTETAN